MPDWLSDWGFLGVVVAVVFGTLGLFVTIAVPYWLYQRSRKRLGFEVRSNAPVIGTSIFDPNEWDIQYKGNPLIDPYVMEVQLENIGGVPIKPEDYESGKPIEIVSGNGAEFVAISRIGHYPQRLSLDIELTQDALQIHPMLINRGEGLYLAIVTEGKCEPKPRARIAGLEPNFRGIPFKSLSPAKTAIDVSLIAWLIALVAFATMMILPYIVDNPTQITRMLETFLSALALAAVILGVGTFIFSRWHIYHWQRRTKA